MKSEIKSKLCSKIYHYSEVGSTNNIAKSFISEKNESGFVVLSNIQTAGYGQKGNFWESPHGGLWCSIAIKPGIPPNIQGLIPNLSALSVAKALKVHNVRTRLKWPNDILNFKDNRKLGGILVEGKVSGSRATQYLVIGIGLNINNTLNQYSAPLRRIVTSTLEILGTEIHLESLLLDIISELENGFNTIDAHGEEQILNEWKKWDNILGERIKIVSNNIVYEGIAKDLSVHGQLILEMKDGLLIKFSSGNVSVLKDLPKADN